MITETQFNNIRNMSVEDKIALLQFLIHDAGMMQPDDAIHALEMKRATFYKYISDGKIQMINVGSRDLPAINYPKTSDQAASVPLYNIS